MLWFVYLFMEGKIVSQKQMEQQTRLMMNDIKESIADAVADGIREVLVELLQDGIRSKQKQSEWPWLGARMIFIGLQN